MGIPSLRLKNPEAHCAKFAYLSLGQNQMAVANVHLSEPEAPEKRYHAET